MAARFAARAISAAIASAAGTPSRSARHKLLELINDLLDFSKLDANRLDFEEVPFHPGSVVQSALDLVANRAFAKGLDFGGFVAPDVPPGLIGDPGRLRQVLLKLLGNAVKFTTSGDVLLDMSAARLPDGACELTFSVTDTGRGIDAEDIPHLFQEFSQVDSTISRRFGGTGLGLAIYHRLLARMGGGITVQSMLGRGSVFRCTARFEIGAPAPGERARGVARLHGHRVPVLYPGAAGAALLARQIESRGGVAHRAGFPETARHMLAQAAHSGTPFHACIIDHGLAADGAERFARTDGIGATKRICELPGMVSQVPVIALTADTSPDNHAAYRAAVVQSVLIKPITLQALGSALADLEPDVMSGLPR